MELQENFDKIIKLLQTKGSSNLIVDELLNHCLNSEVTFSSFNPNSEKVTKSHLLDIYEFRAELENSRKDNPMVFGYEELIPSLQITPNENVCIADITSNIGSYIIFSDYGLTDFIGILKSKRTLREIRNKYLAHKLLIKESGEKLKYNYENEEKVFIDGKLLM